MHRGGTSALAGALVRLGVDPPRTLMPGDAANELGYWESARLWEFHERLLRALGTSWDSWTQCPSVAGHAQETVLAEELRDIIADEFAQSPLFVVKDPRISRFA